MRRRRPAPAGDSSPSVVPLSRAQLVRDESATGGTSGTTQDQRAREKRSRFGELTPATSAPTLAAPGKPNRPTGAAPRVPARARRANAAAEPHDGWTFVLIPPGAGARPRTLRISVRRLRFAVASFFVLVGSTVATGGVLVLALSFLPPAQDEVRGVELGVFASGTLDSPFDITRADSASTPAAIAAASAGAAAPRGTAGRPRSASRPRATGEDLSPSIMESLPVVGEITSRFARSRRHPLLGVVRKHAGIDIAAAAGTPITAPAPGRVSFSGRKFGYGNVVDIDHGNGVLTRYAHCRALMVREGDEVAAGAVIATVGRSGLATAPHLHYEVLVRGKNVNPLRTPLASLLDGKQPAPPTATPRVDSARQAPAPPEPAASDVPEIPEPSAPIPDTTTFVAPSPVAQTPITSGGLPIVLPVPVVRDTVRKSE
jgi:murein DD-endopeptidase MepM/ murein hydrolase activator NlpD